MHTLSLKSCQKFELINKIIDERKWTIFDLQSNEYKTPITRRNSKMSKTETFVNGLTLKNGKQMSRFSFLAFFCKCFKYLIKSYRLDKIEDMYLKKTKYLQKQLLEERKKLEDLHTDEIKMCVKACLQNLVNYKKTYTQLSPLRQKYDYLDSMLKDVGL